MLMATEQPAGFLKASHTLNALISGDRLRVEKKYKDAFYVHPRAKILRAMNDLPRVPSVNEGLFRRVKVVEVEPVPEAKRDPGARRPERGRERASSCGRWRASSGRAGEAASRSPRR